jgi:hypothetical protein
MVLVEKQENLVFARQSARQRKPTLSFLSDDSDSV